MKTRITITLLFAVLFAMFAAPAFAADDDALLAMKAAVATISTDYDYASEVPADATLEELGIDYTNAEDFEAYTELYYYFLTGEDVVCKIDPLDVGDEQLLGLIDPLDVGDEQLL